MYPRKILPNTKTNLMKTLTLAIALLAMMSLMNCDQDNDPNKKVTGTGPVVSKTLNLSTFDKIQNTGVSNFYVTLGEPQSVILQAQQNIIDVMTYEVIGSTLVVGIEENTSIQNADEISFEITINELNEFNLMGVGNLTLSGDFQDELSVTITGVGNVDTYETEIGICNIVLTGVGECRVNVRDELDVTISGVGTVYYRGDPTITQNVTGEGDLIDDN